MVKVTRRRALGLAGGALGLGACATDSVVSSTAERALPATYVGDIRFDHGVASGDPLSDSVVLWTRVTPTKGSGDIELEYRVFDGDTLVSYGKTRTSNARDYTVKAVAEDLSPGREYAFEFVVATSTGMVTSPRGRTKTAAGPNDDSAVRFAVVSCSNYPFGLFNVYREISRERELDAVIHLGDYFYEYGVDGYGGSTGEEIGRRHDPVTETVTLDDYRIRHAQYKTDPDLQAAHAAAPWLCTWDDHESTNNSYRTGAQNHNPEDNEGDWTARKQAAVQAYLEWMPVRDPEPGRARESIYRSFDFGSVASVICLESRLTGRSDEISWSTELAGVAPEDAMDTAIATLTRVSDDNRTMLGAEQESWLAGELSRSVSGDKTWQVLANQVVMARIVPPNLAAMLTPEQMDAITNPFAKQLVGFTALGVPMNLDAWDGFPAARHRLYRDAKAAGARLITLTGDTHTAWANSLRDIDGELRGVEFGCTSVTSPGMGSYLSGVDNLGALFVEKNPEVDHFDPHGNGYTRVTLTPSGVRADYVKVSTVLEPDYTANVSASYVTRLSGGAMTPLDDV